MLRWLPCAVDSIKDALESDDYHRNNSFVNPMERQVGLVLVCVSVCVADMDCLAGITPWWTTSALSG